LIEATALELRQEIGEASFDPLALPESAARDGSSRQVASGQAVSGSTAPVPFPESAASSAPPPSSKEAEAIQSVAPGVDEPCLSAQTCTEVLADVHPAAAEATAETVRGDAYRDDQTSTPALPTSTPERAVALAPTVRTEGVALKPRNGVLLGLVDSTSAALKLAAIARALDGLPDAQAGAGQSRQAIGCVVLGRHGQRAADT